MLLDLSGTALHSAISLEIVGGSILRLTKRVERNALAIDLELGLPGNQLPQVGIDRLAPATVAICLGHGGLLLLDRTNPAVDCAAPLGYACQQAVAPPIVTATDREFRLLPGVDHGRYRVNMRLGSFLLKG